MRTFLAIFVCVAVICEMVAASKLRGMNRLTAKKRMAKRACSDAIDNCASYGQSVCSDSQYTQWVQDNCCAYCSGGGGSVPSTTSGFQLIFATEAPPLPASSGGSCADAIDNCADYTTDVCSNAQYSEWVTTNCPKYCGTCSGSAAATPTMGGGGSSTTCTDTIANCADYGTDVCTNPDYTSWVASNCQKYCNACPSSSSSSSGGSPSIPSTGGSSGTSSGCVYNGNVYQQGQTWKDNCQFACECTDGSTGKYTCTEMCLHWNLPSECSMNPPAPGKCCETPNCPAGFTINYPDGYVEQ